MGKDLFVPGLRGAIAAPVGPRWKTLTLSWASMRLPTMHPKSTVVAMVKTAKSCLDLIALSSLVRSPPSWTQRKEPSRSVAEAWDWVVLPRVPKPFAVSYQLDHPCLAFISYSRNIFHFFFSLSLADRQPFAIRFLSDSGEEAAESIKLTNTGFKLTYIQTTTGC